MRPYRGWKSTKLHLALITAALMTLVYGLVGFPATSFGEYCMALIAAAGIYSGAAAAEKFAKPSAPEPDVISRLPRSADPRD